MNPFSSLSVWVLVTEHAGARYNEEPDTISIQLLVPGAVFDPAAGAAAFIRGVYVDKDTAEVDYRVLQDRLTHGQWAAWLESWKVWVQG